MMGLSEVVARLRAQFFDSSALKFDDTALEEATRCALEALNGQLGTAYQLSGLDSVEAGDLPVELWPALVSGAAAHALDYALRQQLAGLGNTPAEAEKMADWARHLQRQFESQVERARLLDLQGLGTTSWTAAWPWVEKTRWQG